MNANHDFQIGHNHIICQDYATSGVVENGAYAIVCDGCSGSPDVDCGARLLALAAREVIFGNPDIDEKQFSAQVLVKLAETQKIYPFLDYRALDSTLLVAWVKNKLLKVFGYGDGVIYIKQKDSLRIRHIELTSGAPDYLSYNLTNGRKQDYLDTLPGELKEITTESIDTGITLVNPFDAIAFEIPVETGDIVALSSDGINSFRKANNDPIIWRDLVNDFFGFKNTQGEFVQRRLSALRRTSQKQLITHGDDISVASIII